MISKEDLFKRFIANKCSPDEIRDLLELFTEAENELVLKQLILKQLEESIDTRLNFTELETKERELYRAISKDIKVKKPVWFNVAAAAVIMFFLSVGIYSVLITKSTQQLSKSRTVDRPAGGNRAVLTLANGQEIILTGAKKGRLANQNNTSIMKTADGLIMYDAKKSSGKMATAYNTMTTPRGGQYRLTLADGTSVWLNSASSITYPASFTGNERKVQLKGEAYFEVAHNPSKPFLVISGSQEVKVLGTHFNINAYADEPSLKTTLLAGSIRISIDSKKMLLHPGQQAVLIINKLSLGDVNLQQAVAWKNGIFQFEDEDLESIMRKLSRWYDVDIEYADNEVKSLPFTGIITHFSNISGVLKMLELTRQVHFKIEKNKVIVTK